MTWETVDCGGEGGSWDKHGVNILLFSGGGEGENEAIRKF